MSKLNIPLSDRLGEEELADFLKDKLQGDDDIRHAMLKLQAADMLMQKDEEILPDTYGADRMVLDSFVTAQMLSDFPLIARDFYIHEMGNLKEYEDVEYMDTDSGADWPERMFVRFTMSLMMNAVNSGSEYTKSLFLHLYKVYHKKEYKALKRFRTLSASELLSLAEPEDGRTGYVGNLARILFAARLHGIKIGPGCNYLYATMNRVYDRSEERGRYSLTDENGERYRQCLKEIEEKYDSKKLYFLEGRISRFLSNVFKWLGYCPDYADLCDDNAFGLTNDLAKTLSILKKTYPDRDYTEEELTIYAAVLHCASALTCSMDWMADTLQSLAYGEDGTYYYDDFPSMFKPEDVKVLSEQKKPQAVKKPKEPVLQVDTGKDSYDEEVLLAEVEALRRKVRKLEADNDSLRGELSDKRKVQEEAKTVKDRLEAANRELAVLRDYVYNLTEEDSPEQSVSLSAMKEVLSGKRIVIIGGHSNWISKMKKEFPGWVFIKPGASGSTDISIVDKADHVYFFTDTISHSRYYQFLTVVRERKIDFGYIHGVNIEKNIRDIYRDYEQ